MMVSRAPTRNNEAVDALDALDALASALEREVSKGTTPPLCPVTPNLSWQYVHPHNAITEQ